MSKNLCPVAVALAALAAPAFAQTGNQVALPAYGNTYNGFSRGYSFTAGSNFFIQDTELDTTAQQAGDTMSIRVVVNGTEVMYSAGTPGPIITPAGGPLQIFSGDLVEVVGNWSPAVTGNFSAHNSYGAGGGTYATPIEGVSTTLFRAGVQWDIGDPAYVTAGTFNSITGSMGRAFIYTTPPAGLFASFDASPSTGAAPLTVTFTDTSFSSDPNGVTSWAWDFDGDGNTDATTATATWVYATCGAKDVSLTVTDATHPASTTTVVGAVQVDNVVADFSVAELAAGTGLWQFTDLSTPTPTAWAWDFDGDGNVDDTTQNPVYVDPTMGSILSLPNCELTVTGAGGCFTNTLQRAVVAYGTYVAPGPTAGGNGTSSTTAAGTYWDMQVVNPEGVNINGWTAAVYGFAGTADVRIYITPGQRAGNEGNAANWTLAGEGTATWNGTGTVGAPEFAAVALTRPFYLPAGNYGVAVYQQDQAGGAMQVSYTNGPGNSPYGNNDIVIHPAGDGCSSVVELGACAFTPRLWNGVISYELCSVAGNAAAGTFALGCANSAGFVPTLEVVNDPVLGASFTAELDAQLPAPIAGVMCLGLSNTVYNGLPLPLDLAILGAPGCNLAAAAESATTLLLAPGANSFSLALPNNPALSCGKFYAQAAVLDPAANAFGFVLSNAVAASMGN